MYSFKVLALAICCMAYTCIFAQKEIYRDSSQPVEKRVKDLIRRMTLEEKIDQMSMNSLDEIDSTSRMYGVAESPFESIGSVVRASVKAKLAARQNTRLGIPPLQIAECLHGVLAYGATIFPQAIAQGCTWNPDLVREMAEAIAREASVMGVDQALSPLFDLIRDARYGRNEECFSEDPFLVGELGKAFVIGMQGDTCESLPVISQSRVLCTAKHFAAYSIPLAGLNLSPTPIGERDLRTYFLPPFEKAVKEAGVASIMPSYSEIEISDLQKTMFSSRLFTTHYSLSTVHP